MKRRADTEQAGVGIRELKAHLSRYLGLVKEGRAVYVTERGKAVAQILPARPEPGTEAMQDLVRKGIIHWNGGHPRGATRRIRARGKLTSRVVLEMRRESLSRY